MNQLIGYLINGVAIGCVYAMLGSGLVAIYRVTTVVNVAQGTFAVIGGLIASSALAWGLPHGLGELVGVVVSGALGLLVGKIALTRRGIPPISSLVITIGIAVAAYALEVGIWGSLPISLNGIHSVLKFSGVTVQGQYLLIIAVSILVFAGLWAFFSKSYIGLALTACSSNGYGAKVLGIDVRRMGVIAFGLGGVLGGLSGVLIMPVQPLSFNSDINFVVMGFAAAVMGGMTRFEYALIGGIVLGVVEEMIAGYWQATYQLEVALGIVILAMIFEGVLSGRRGTAAWR